MISAWLKVEMMVSVMVSIHALMFVFSVGIATFFLLMVGYIGFNSAIYFILEGFN